MSLEQELEALRKENADLKNRLEAFHTMKLSTRSHGESSAVGLPGENEHVSIIVIGASGDLAKKKTFPSLFALHGLGLLPKNFTIFGYSRTALSDNEFRKLASSNFKGWDAWRESFLSKCVYVSGQYGSAEDFKKLHHEMEKVEQKYGKAHRVFYLAIPPSIFVDVAKAARQSAVAPNGWTRLIIEKPFGRDSESSTLLSRQLAELWEEEALYRIDHYLGKEMVQNLMSIRFGNTVFEPIWNRNHIANVTITFKEDIGTEALTAMEPPVSFNAEDVRDEKVKVLRSCKPIQMRDVVIGQYGRDASGKKESYLDDPTVPKGSLAPTFAQAVIHINNNRWQGVPFILKCGKALNERKAEIRIQFKQNNFYPDASRNEFVFRVQPNEAVYLKFNGKKPGLANELTTTELDLTYKQRFDERLPDAYERLIYDVLRGDHNLFVRVDELEAAWAIFTPMLHQIENEKIKPEIYPFGSRGPESADKLATQYGFVRQVGYQWKEKAKI